MRYVFLFSAVLGGVLLYLLSIASSNGVSSQYYTLLLVLNIAFASVMLALIAWQLWKLYQQINAKVMGSRLTLRLLSTYALMAIIPGLIVYAVSVNFLTRSIESWFNVKVEAALEGGLRLGQSTLDIMLNDLAAKADNMGQNIALQAVKSYPATLNDLREKASIQEVALLNMQGRVIAFSSSDAASFLPLLPSLSQLQHARSKTYSKIEPLKDKGLYLRVLTPIHSANLAADSLGNEVLILQLLQPVPKTLSDTAESVQTVYQDYQELSYSRGSLKDVFALSLTLVLMLALLSAIAIAFILSRRLSAPLSVLAEGTRAIARGDYGAVLPEHGKDELGVLVKSFNSMSQQLNDATLATEANRARVTAAYGYLSTVLAHLSSGVLTLDNVMQIKTFNKAAANILQVPLEPLLSCTLADMSRKHENLEGFVARALTHFKREAEGEWQEQIELSTAQGKQTLIVRGTQLPAGVDSGFVLVFDDITQVVQAQRDAAWGEVARRLAHEIKNPLTPIQLSAERLAHKLADKLNVEDAEVLKRATSTIVTQVSAMKTMVNEFSEYARAPALNLSAIELNALIKDVLVLYEASGIKMHLHLEAAGAHIQGDATMLRQVLHNLLKNAQDALETVAQPELILTTVAEAQKVILTLQDNGAGFSADTMAHIFEPYMTTKPQGTGLGLAIVKKIVEEHKGKISIENAQPCGARVKMSFPQIIDTELLSPVLDAIA